MSTLVEIMRALRAMPQLPEVVARVLDLARSPSYSIDAVVAIVHHDHALTGRLLSLCRRTAGAQAHIASVSDAVATLGARNVVKLVLACSVERYFRDLPTNDYARPGELWRQTLAFSTACQLLAELCGYDQPVKAFTAGIVHNIGRVAIVQVVDATTLAAAARELRDPGEDPVLAERRTFGIDHATAGGIVAETWELSADLRRAVRNHHERAHLSSDDELTSLLHTAELLVPDRDTGAPSSARRSDVQEPALRRLQLTDRDLDEARERAVHDLEQLAGLINARPLPSR